MEIKSHTSNGITVLGLTGRLEARNSAAVRQMIHQAGSTSPTNLVINLKDVTFIDSSGLAVLVQGMKLAKKQDGKLRLCHLQQSVRIIFELTRLDKAFEIFPDESSAVAAFK